MAALPVFKANNVDYTEDRTKIQEVRCSYKKEGIRSDLNSSLQFFEKFEATPRFRGTDTAVAPDEEDGDDLGLADIDLDLDAGPAFKYRKQLVCFKEMTRVFGFTLAHLAWIHSNG